MNRIEDYIIYNSDYYQKLKKQISTNIDGRICHHKVEIINAVLELMDNPKNYLEIGVHNGTSMSYAVSTTKKINCYGIDLFESSHDTKYRPDNLQQDRTLNNIEKNNSSDSRIRLIKGDSTDKKTHQFLENMLRKEKIDLLFIDGNHTYDYIKSDFYNYEKYLRNGGFLIIDDYEPRYPGIVKFVSEIENRQDFKFVGVYKENDLILQKVEIIKYDS